MVKEVSALSYCGHRSRRRFLAECGSGLVLFLGGQAKFSAAEPESSLPTFDREMEAFMSAGRIPGGSLAVVRSQRLVYARGYGSASRNPRETVRPDSLFRIASVAKPITSAAILKLVEENKLSLDSPMIDRLSEHPQLGDLEVEDSRARSITVRHLLQHTGGWDRNQGGDPMFKSHEIAKAAKRPPPAEPADIIRWVLKRRLDFDPGTRYVYSNFGYCLLGRIIEAITGKSYESFVRERILGPLGIARMRMGRSLSRQEGEVDYFTANDRTARSVFTEGHPEVPEPWGSFYLESLDAHGGWIASATDLVIFAAALDKRAATPILASGTIDLLWAPPPPPVSRARDGTLDPTYYACGWMVRPKTGTGRANYWHAGRLPGTSSLLVRRWDGLIWAVLFNQQSGDPAKPDAAIDGALHRACEGVKSWPEGTALLPPRRTTR